MITLVTCIVSIVLLVRCMMIALGARIQHLISPKWTNLKAAIMFA